MFVVNIVFAILIINQINVCNQYHAKLGSDHDHLLRPLRTTIIRL